MATKFNTKPGEEQFINTVIKNGFKFELPKYIMLRLAINISFRLPYYSLDNKIWSDSISYSGENAKGAEYNYEQVTGLGKEKDYTNVLRAMFAWRHRDENIDFSDDAHFEKTVEKYIHRGLLEIYNTYKASDDFYQWLIDNLKLSGLDEKPSLTSQQNLNTSLQEDLLHYFKKENLSIEILDYRDAIRHDVCKIHIKEQKDYKTLNKSISTFKNEFGLYGEADLCEVVGEKMNFLLYLPRAKNEWKNFGFDEFKADLDKANKAEIEVYCGRTLYNEPYFFDLNDCPHLLVAGTTGSGKSVLLNTIIASIAKLNKNTEFVLIDPKNGAEFGFYEKTRILSDITQNKVIKDMNEVGQTLNSLIDEMERRYGILESSAVSKNSDLATPLNNIIVVIDEVADMFSQIKVAQANIERLAQKARACGIHLILATQSPNSDIFSQTLRLNIPARIALKVTTSKQSIVAIDEIGAENLLGRGDIFFKPNCGEKVRIIAPFLEKDDILKFLA